MNIILKPKHQKFIQSQVENGSFADADQVIELAFQLLNDYLEWVKDTHQKIDVAIIEMDNNEGLDGKTFVNEIISKLASNY